MRWTLEYSVDLEPPVWHRQEDIEAVPSFEEFEDLFRDAHENDPAQGYYRIRLEGSDGGWSTYSWDPPGRLVGTRVPVALESRVATGYESGLRQGAILT